VTDAFELVRIASGSFLIEKYPLSGFPNAVPVLGLHRSSGL
jgi:hypothetical protein